MRIGKILVGIGLAASVAAASGCWWLLGERSTELRFQGTVEVQEVRLGSKLGGRIAEVLIHEGYLVQAGQVLVRLEAPELEAQREQSLAQVQAKSAALERMHSGARAEEKEAADFFVPGLMVVLCQMMATTLAATAIVREKESGTLEQLFLTPVRSWELVIGKMAPYLVHTILEFGMIALFMTVFFAVPIHGSFVTLLTLALPFVLTMLAVGLLISTRASTRDAAMQMAMGTILPAVFLSGYVSPADSMPAFFRYLSQLVPATWLIDAARGVILRGAGQAELWRHALVLWTMALATLIFSSLRFRKQVA
jgi:ABC-2 type transport system permease protein